MSKLNLQGFGQAGIAFPEINVQLVVRNPETGEIVHKIEKHNRVCRLPLYVMLRAINGEYSRCDDKTVEINKRFQLYNYIPRFIAFGNGDSEIDVNDVKLDSELDYPRMKLIKNNQIENFYNSPYIRLTIKHFVPLEAYKGETISEAGLFCEETGDNLWARVIFDPFVKDNSVVIDVTWTITIVIIETEEKPYEMVDKLPLRTTIRDALKFLNSRYEGYEELAKQLRIANDVFASKAVSQLYVDNVTQSLLAAIEGVDSITVKPKPDPDPGIDPGDPPDLIVVLNRALHNSNNPYITSQYIDVHTIIMGFYYDSSTDEVVINFSIPVDVSSNGSNFDINMSNIRIPSTTEYIYIKESNGNIYKIQLDLKGPYVTNKNVQVHKTLNTITNPAHMVYNDTNGNPLTIGFYWDGNEIVVNLPVPLFINWELDDKVYTQYSTLSINDIDTTTPKSFYAKSNQTGNTILRINLTLIDAAIGS